MTTRRRIAGLAAATALALTALPMSASGASSYDHKDPYATGCATGSYAVRSAPIDSRALGNIGTVRLMWSPSCKTNWTDISVSSSAKGSIYVYRRNGGAGNVDQFNYSSGRTHRWGNMLYAPGVCAWGSATVAGAGGTNGSGATSKACG
jgi:Protein of unknown function (DUF2690)